MADGDLDIDALLEGPIDQKQDRDKSQSKEVRERVDVRRYITTAIGARCVCLNDNENATAGIRSGLTDWSCNSLLAPEVVAYIADIPFH